MNQFRIIYLFELKNYLRNKVFLIMTIIVIAVLAVLLTLPRIFTGEIDEATEQIEAFQSGEVSTEDILSMAADGKVYLVKNGLSLSDDDVTEAFRESFGGSILIFTDEDESSIRSKIQKEEAEGAFLIRDDFTFTYLVGTMHMYDMNASLASDALQKLYRVSEMRKSGLTDTSIDGILDREIVYETEALGVDQEHNYFHTYIMTFALYIFIMIYGQMVAQAVANEKSSRAMELLVTSARPTPMMFGKVLAAGTAGFLQLLLIFGSAFLFYNINRSYVEKIPVVGSVFDIPARLLILMLIFFVLGFLLYASLYAAVGSMASKLEDVQSLSMPMTLVFVVSFMVAIFSMSSGSADNLLIKICSFIPFTSSMSMFTRAAMSTVPLWQILISIGILVVSVAGFSILAARIYRIGILMYGLPPKPATILRVLKDTRRSRAK